MALSDIVFNQGEGQDFILEISGGSLNSPTDIVLGADQFTARNDSEFPVMETTSSGAIFIMTD